MNKREWDFDPDSVTFPSGHFIDGRYVFDTANVVAVRRPSDGMLYRDLPVASADLVDRAVSGAQIAVRASNWASQPPRMRGAVLRRWAELIERDAVQLSRVEAIGSTRPIEQVLTGDLPYLSETIRFFAEFADKHGGEVAATEGAKLGMMISEPHGVIAAILPWNYPLAMAGWKLGPALAAGNAVVLKPSELTPFSVLRVAELAIEAGIPAGILNIVQGPGEQTGSHLVRHPGIAKITFTGSTRAGALIMAESAHHGLKPVTLELGGKSPQIAFSDCDIELTAQCIARSILNNAGQECVAGSRLIVHHSIKSPLLSRIAALMQSVEPGMTWSGSTRYGPIISDTQIGKISDIIAMAKQQGAYLLCGGSKFAEPYASFFQPSIIDNVTPTNIAVKQEIFGPVLAVQSFEDEEEGIQLCNDTEFGLAAGLYTHDLSRALRVQRRLDAGTIWINRYGRSDDFIISTGGFKNSGFGKDLGREAFMANLRTKSVLIDIH